METLKNQVKAFIQEDGQPLIEIDREMWVNYLNREISNSYCEATIDVANAILDTGLLPGRAACLKIEDYVRKHTGLTVFVINRLKCYPLTSIS